MFLRILCSYEIPEIQMQMDYFAAFASIYLAVVWILYALTVIIQYRSISRNNYHFQVLSARCALCLPIYSSCYYLSILFPSLYDFFHIILTFAEGIALAALFCLIVLDLGGPDNAVTALLSRVEIFNHLRVSIVCPCIGKSNELANFYKYLSKGLLQCIWLRPILSTIAAVLESMHIKIGIIIALVVTICSMVILIRTFILFLKFCKCIHRSCYDLKTFLIDCILFHLHR
jgi:hypothetical protein